MAAPAVIRFPRQLPNATSAPPNTGDTSQSFESWLAQYWFVLLIVLAVLVVVCVLVCACIIRNKPRSPSLPITGQPNLNINSGDNGYTSSQQSSLRTMPSLSGDSTPIPSPNSSQQSVRAPSSQGGVPNGRSRRASPRLSSASSDTLRFGAHSVSSNSSSASFMAAHSPSRQSPLEKQTGGASFSRRSRTGPIVRVTSMPDVKNTPTGVGGANEGLRTAPSTVSVQSSSSGKSGVSYRFQPATDPDAIVEVGVTVHTPGDPDKAVRIATAAALAESARRLAQEAASFIDEEATGDHTHLRGINPYRPGSGRMLRYTPTAAPPLSYSSSGRSPDMERQYLAHAPLSRFSQASSIGHAHQQRSPSSSALHDSDYHSYRATPSALDSDPNLYSLPSDSDPYYPHAHVRGRSSSLYGWGSKGGGAEHYHPQHSNSSLRYLPQSESLYHQRLANNSSISHRRSSDTGLQQRRTLSSFNSASTARKSLTTLHSQVGGARRPLVGHSDPMVVSRSERRFATPTSSPDCDVDNAETACRAAESRGQLLMQPKRQVSSNGPLVGVVNGPLVGVVDGGHLSHSPSNSTGLSSAHTDNGSQFEEHQSLDNATQSLATCNVTTTDGLVSDCGPVKSPLVQTNSNDSHVSSEQSSTETESHPRPESHTRTESHTRAESHTRTDSHTESHTRTESIAMTESQAKTESHTRTGSHEDSGTVQSGALTEDTVAALTVKELATPLRSPFTRTTKPQLSSVIDGSLPTRVPDIGTSSTTLGQQQQHLRRYPLSDLKQQEMRHQSRNNFRTKSASASSYSSSRGGGGTSNSSISSSSRGEHTSSFSRHNSLPQFARPYSPTLISGNGRLSISRQSNQYTSSPAPAPPVHVLSSNNTAPHQSVDTVLSVDV